MDRSGKYHTVDGVMISPNLRVFDTKNWVWGNVDPYSWSLAADIKNVHETIYYPGSKHFDGYYWVVLDNGYRILTNGRRMMTQTPQSTDPTPDKLLSEETGK